MARTPLHAFRIPPELYDAALAKSIVEGRTVTSVVLDALTAYAHPPKIAPKIRPSGRTAK